MKPNKIIAKTLDECPLKELKKDCNYNELKEFQRKYPLVHIPNEYLDRPTGLRYIFGDSL